MINNTFKIGVASGKGGTGKTTVSVNLYHAFCNNISNKTQLVDCDVEEPNAGIFFTDSIITNRKKIMRLVPEIDVSTCNFCKKCDEYCEFNAISIIPSQKYANVTESLCHSCGACTVACKYTAITEREEEIGAVNCYDLGYGNGLVEGCLKIGSTMQTMLISKLKKHVAYNNDIEIYDAPPGTSCSVVETLVDTDFILLVSEPTPFGLYDLKLMVDLLKSIKKPFALIINKAGIGNNEIYKYCKTEHIEILDELPFSKQYASSYAGANILNEIPDDISSVFFQLSQNIERRFC